MMNVSPYMHKCSFAWRVLARVMVCMLMICVPFVVAAQADPDESEEDTAEDRSFLERTTDLISDTFAYIVDFFANLFGGGDGEEDEEVASEDEPAEPATTVPQLPPPQTDGVTTILDSITAGLAPASGTFVINTNLRVTNALEVAGTTDLSDLSVSGPTDLSTLTVSGSTSALGGVDTGGADIDLGGGDILGTDLVTSIEAGENVEISGSTGDITISVPNAGQTQIIDRGGGSSGGVESLNTLTGELVITGTADQISVAESGSNITLSLPQDIAQGSSPVFDSLTLSGNLDVSGDANLAGLVTGGSFESAAGDATVRESGEEILRASVSIFPFALPADTGSTTYERVSDEFTAAYDNPVADTPPAIDGTTREYRLILKYADSVPTTDVTEWRIYKPSTSTTVDTFTISGQNQGSLDEPQVFITAAVTIPEDDWQLQVRVPSGRIRVADIHMASLDVVD